MDKNNDNKIRKAQVDAKQIEQKPQVRKASKKKKNPVAPSPVGKSPAAVSPGKQPKQPIPRVPTPSVEQEKNKDKVVKKKNKTSTETDEEEWSERKYIKFIDQVSFVGQFQIELFSCKSYYSENGTTLNTYYLTHLLNVAQSLKSYEAFTRNTFKNRNPDVFCIDKTRVKLTDPNIEFYIHANHIKFERLNKTYIATQHPLQNTLNDFWAMITDQGVDVIVSLTHSSNTNSSIFPIYYPDKAETFRNFGQFYVYCKAVIPPKTKYECTEYKLEMVAQSDKEQKHKIRLFHYSHWVKNTVPASGKVVLDIVKKLGRRRSRGPIVVQCETGVNQSAEVIYVDAICSLLRNNLEANFDSLFRQMRKQRAQMMTQRLHFLHSLATVLEFIKYRYKPLPAALFIQIESIQFSISKDFRYNTSIEPEDRHQQLKSPTMIDLVSEDNAK
ncbi:hypothetical protein CAEBREN_06002 [Caenorhabditis brenneri]|uniref:Tyrosine-protein phosphatase domain-containing protein n=1 Tax=Caenorhabditis brenneri TaxID=135651 RepID=G0MVH2_CAEBE|nr:hypothetical protein CAEBREN_06002 [Caenorhabditis brenneri]